MSAVISIILYFVLMFVLFAFLYRVCEEGDYDDPD